MLQAIAEKTQTASQQGTATRTYLATLADGTTARVTIPQGYHPALGGGEVARVKAVIARPIHALAIVGPA